MIQIVPCANCEKSLVLPLNASLKAKVQCPSCTEEFVVGEMITSRYGVWSVIEDPEPVVPQRQYTGGIATAAAHSIAADLGDGEELKLAEEDPKPKSKTKTKTNVDWSDFKPITYEQYEKLKRDSRSPFWSVFQIVMGAVMAVPLSLLLIWNLMDKDVMGAGPFIARFAPWVVPEKFRGDVLEEGADPAMAAAGDDALDPTLDNYGDGEYADEDGYGGEDSYGEEMGEEEAELAGMSYEDTYQQSLENQGEEAGGDTADGLATAMVRPRGRQSDPEKPVKTKRENRKSTRPSLSSASGSSASGSPSAGQQHQSIPNIFSLMRTSDRNLDNWRVANRLKSSDLAELTEQVYSDLLEVADGISELPEGNPILSAVRQAMQPIGVDVKRYEELQQAVADGAAAQFENNEDEDVFSVAIVVEIADVIEEREEWVLEAEDSEFLPSDLVYAVPKSLAPSLNPGQKLLLLGQVVRPQESDDSDDEEQSEATGETEEAGESDDTEAESEESGAPNQRKFTACYLHAL